MSLHDVSAQDLTLVDETALDDPECRALDLIFTAEEYEALDYQFKRRLAAAAASDEINGKSDGMLMRSFFVRQTSLDEFSD